MTTSSKAALYLRSSKDRKDVSLDSQREELQALATSKNLTIAEEFSDVVESGSTENRPGYQELCRAVSNKNRGWNYLLILDTSRLARDQLIAITFTQHCQRAGIKIMYSTVPDMQPITEMMVLAVFRAMDQIHAHTSKEKGLAGMQQNIKRGFRAGGSAPRGYVLEKVGQGIMREGAEIKKSRLAIDEAKAPAVQHYLKLRAAGRPRSCALKESGLDIEQSTSIYIEWNALQYAGHTVWGRSQNGSFSRANRKPRNEWQIQRNTHPALITDDEAEKILTTLENSEMGAAVSHAKRRMSHYLLSDLLVTSDGRRWRGSKNQQGSYYRLDGTNGSKGRNLPADKLDSLVVQHLVENLKSDTFVDSLYKAARTNQIDTSTRRKKQAALKGIAQKISQHMDNVLMLNDPAPIYRKVDELERERKRLESEVEQHIEEERLQRAASHISRETITDMLDSFADAVEQAETQDKKNLLAALLEQVSLDADLKMQLHFRLSTTTSFSADSLCVVTPQKPTAWTIRSLIEIRLNQDAA